MPSEDPILKIEHLAKHFTSGRGRNQLTVKAVDDVSFSVNRAETFGLVGESGCGKTTTGRTIIRLYDPTGGGVNYNGREISGKMTNALRNYLTENIAMVFQDPVESLNPRMTVEEIIGEGLRVRGVKDRHELRSRVYAMLDMVGLTEEHATRYPHEFSGGQRQRIGIARAIITKPTTLITDEPVSALDVSIRSQIINLLNDLKQELRLTILFIAHDLSIVKYFSDKIGVMYNGKLVELGRSDNIYQNPVHPYTKSLLSAIPHPNPRLERKRKRLTYEPPPKGRYGDEVPQMRLAEPEHYVYACPSELNEYMQRG